MADKLTQAHLKKQVARLKVLPRGDERPWGTDKEPGLREELLRVLWQQAASDEHATRIIDHLMDGAEFCPTPAELMAAAQEVPERLGMLREADAQCVNCGGSGWKRTQVGSYSGVKRCECTLKEVSQ